MCVRTKLVSFASPIILLPSLGRVKRFSTSMAQATTPSVTKLSLPEFTPVENKVNPVKYLSEGSVFRIVSYNMLAQVYVKSILFPHSPRHCLRWKARSEATLTMLKALDADFLCLQELDEYESFYKEKIEQEGYASTYIQRSGRKRDGCGIFYKTNRSKLLLQEVIDYNDLVPVDDSLHNSCDPDDKDSDIAETPVSTNSGSEERGDLNDPKVRLKRDCVGLLTLFRLIDPPHHSIIVANTHIYWDPELIDVKVAQVKYLLERLARFREKAAKEFNCAPLVVVAGDFNSTPGDKVYQYLTSWNSESEGISESSECPKITLNSLYSFLGGEPPFTNCTPDFTGTLDYILFSNSEHMQPISYLKLPTSDSPHITGGLPNESYPSDHLPIGADFEIL